MAQALGIDLGTTYSLLAWVGPTGTPVACPDARDASKFRTPSTVVVGPDGVLVGDAAELQAEDMPALPVARHFKLRLGEPGWRHAGGGPVALSATGLSALVLRKLMADHSVAATDEPGEVVLTVPAQFSDVQRRATLAAAGWALPGRVRLVEEPVAAAAYCGLTAGERPTAPRHLFVYDLGGGTFDATVLRLDAAGLHVLATDGTVAAGGVALDGLLAARWAARHLPSRAMTESDEAWWQLLRLAEQAKVRLAQPGAARFDKPMLVGGKVGQFAITLPEWEAMMGPVVDLTLDSCRRALAAAGLTWAQVDTVVLTGGSSLIPYVQRRVAEASGKSGAAFRVRQPHQAVAFGAALLANGTEQGNTPVSQVAGFDLGLAVRNPTTGKAEVRPVIRRNTPLPAQATLKFYTAREDQTRMVFDLVQSRGEPGAEQTVNLGRFQFGPIPNPAKNKAVELRLSYGADGLARATATDLVSGFRQEFSVSETGVTAVDAGATEEAAYVRRVPLNA